VSQPPEDMEVRLAAQQALLDQRVQAGEWFDIYTAIVRSSVEQTVLRSGGTAEDSAAKLKDYLPAWSKVRRELEARGMHMDEELEVEGPDVRHDELGIPSIVTWPRGVWVEIRAKGSSEVPLRFEGLCALSALTFIQWWVGFQQVHLAREGKLAEKKRIVEPGSAEYIDYIETKRREQGN
jgi:hypothetical protein